ncbi:FAD/NAD(P)-binding protein [Kibdelosporangium banguiense]|uniref:FAD/NAD(P)-binding protein n=1 Tax=Kibdelosporangium banguiense TaxID=1365924 RepID=UPI001AEB7EE0|nr:FAD/NAD(P)-binding protein [Kibdelosporangium banguiense]
MPPTQTVAIIGAGPRGTGVLERLGANLEPLAPGRRLEVHLIDPFPPGPGRVWRHAQSPLLRMNSMAEDVTMFTDDSVTCEGPIRPGPSLSEWATLAQTGRIDGSALCPHVLDEVHSLTGTTFPTRRLQSAYLTWFFEQTVAGLGDNVTVHVHKDTVVRVTGGEDEPQLVWLATTSEPVVADVVVFALGHLDSAADDEQSALARYAEKHGLFYLPPEYSADSDLDGIQPGQDVLMRGFGLAFIDLMVLLTEGRGGKYRPEADGTLTYLPSGEEPRLFVGSRRGVPYHSKTNYRLLAGRPPLPRFFGPDAVAHLVSQHAPVDFRSHVWPLMAKDIAWGHYHELFNGHPDRVLVTWAEFAERFAGLTWDTDGMRALVAETVPDADDRLDLSALDHPLQGLRFETFGELQDHLCALIREDVDRRSTDQHSADLGAFAGLLSAFVNLAPLAAARRLTTISYVRDVGGWWLGFFSFLASGPPGHRLEELLALSRAGIVHFVGAGMRVDTVDGQFAAHGSSSPHTVRATALIEARIPKPTLERTTNDLLRSLYESGDGAPEVLLEPRHGTGQLLVSPTDLRLVNSAGRAHPRRFALGAPTSVVAVAAFSRPKVNSPAFRQNDLVARAVLRTPWPARSTCAAAAEDVSPGHTARGGPGRPR